MFKVIDTHTHFDAEEFDEDRAEAFARASEAGVGKGVLACHRLEDHARSPGFEPGISGLRLSHDWLAP